MEYTNVTIEERIQNHITNYTLEQIYDVAGMKQYFQNLAQLSGAQLMLTDRHGEKLVCTEGYQTCVPDVVKEPGTKIRIENHTVAHLYTNTEGFTGERKRLIDRMIGQAAEMYAQLGQETYIHKELDLYSNELEQVLKKEKYRVTHGDKEDALTGVLNKTYFENRRQIIDRAEVVPVAEICMNINDWKFVYDHFGNEESDRLIRVIGEIIQREAKKDYVIGRVDGDVFAVLISLPENGEADDYCRRVQAACEAYEDDKLAPSVACGIIMKDNVEQRLSELYSDAEYEMFDCKYRMKKEALYQERLNSALKKVQG